MTQEEKAKAYDKALKRAKDILFGSTDTSQSVTKEMIEDIFPELAQSEDERIRKALIFYLGDMPEDTELRNGVTNRDVFAWLEKQGEKDKPTYNISSKDVQLTQEEYNKKRASDEATIKEVEAYKKGLEDAQKIFEKQGEYYTKKDVDDAYLEGMVCAKNELEKQDEQTEKMKKEIAEFIFMSKGDIKHRHDWIKCLGYDVKFFEDGKQGEQNSADNVEPKFRKGDWVVYKNDICQIVKREEGCNKLVTVFGIEKELVNERNLSTARLWTIQDAKDGDVLYLQHDGKEHIIIYKGIIKERFRTFVSAYCAYNGIVDDFCFADVSKYGDIAYGGIMPATEEQRDLLFQKMKEAGYEWSDKDRKLIKIVK